MKRRHFITTTFAGAAFGAIGAGCRPRHHAQVNDCAGPAREPFACHYTRMFPHLARKPSSPDSALEQGLADLGARMIDSGSDDADGSEHAGYTYFGQLIDHDLTLDITPLEFAHPHVEHIQNYRTPFLDLDHIYGGGPTVSPFLYEINGPPGRERFIIGKTTGPDCSLDDLPRNANGIAIVMDPRQDENLIIAQLHVAFLKFHNCIMAALAEPGKDSIKTVGPPEGTHFQQARRFVTWHYQYAVVHDFLQRVLCEELFNQVVMQCSESPIQKAPTFRIPVEFSAAVFRFGHSMARDLYRLITVQPRQVSLACLLAFTGAGGGQDSTCPDPPHRPIPFALPADWKMEWSNLFYMPGSNSLNLFRKIDTSVARALHELRIEDVNKFSVATTSDSSKLMSPKKILPVRTLWRGARMGVPSGQQVAAALGIKNPLQNDEIRKSRDPEVEKILARYGFHEDTPLWYYILKEAEIRGSGDRLGPVGSRIVANVIVASLRADPNSYVSVDPKWKPAFGGITPDRVIGDILYFVKRREELFNCKG